MSRSMLKALLTGFIASIIAGPALAGPGPAGHAHAHAWEAAYGKPGNPKKPARRIEIAMREADGKMLFVPERIEVRKGEQVRLTLRNAGALDHEFVLATAEENLRHMAEMQKNPDMEHDDPNARRLAPDRAGEILWQFTRAGEFDFSCLIPGHREAGMKGTIIVK